MSIRTIGVQPAQLDLYHSETVLGWRKIRPISFAQGERKVAQGVMRRVNDEMGNHIGYQILAASASRVDKDVVSTPLPIAITAGQMALVAGTAFARGQSRTDGMSEARRLERAATRTGRGDYLPPEDRIERVMRKVQVYAQIGAAKGDILRVWPQGAAEPLMAAGV